MSRLLEKPHHFQSNIFNSLKSFPFRLISLALSLLRSSHSHSHLVKMQFSSTAILLPFFALANLAASTPISPRQADPSCAPLSKLAAQLSDFEKFSTFILKNAPNDLQRAISDAQKGVASIVSPIDLLNPQVQSLQNTILADLSTVGGEFQKATQANNEGEIVDVAVEIQKILFQRLWPDAVGITALVHTIGDCSSGAPQS